MLTTFEQVKDWIQDNGFKRWVFYRDKSRAEKIIDSNAFTVSDQDDKIDMTEKYLRMAGGTAYAAGSATGAQADLNVTAEVRLQEPQAQQPTAGIAGNYPSIGELTETITKQVRAEMDVQRMKDKEAELSRREKELDAREQSAMGALVHFLAPVGQALLQKHVMPRLAGVDAEEPVHAAPIVPNQPQETPEEKEPEDFTDEESQEIYALLVRFKKVEPDYLVMLRKVVDMAESGDATYNMAKGFLVQ